METVRKRTGSEEEFNRSKLEVSLRRAGVPESTAREVVSKIEPTDGLTTQDVRSRVLPELKSKDATAAEQYMKTHRLTAKSSEMLDGDVCRLNPKTMRHLDLSSGGSLFLRHAGKSCIVHAEESSSVGQREIHLSHEALRTLGTLAHTRLAVRRHAD